MLRVRRRLRKAFVSGSWSAKSNSAPRMVVASASGPSAPTQMLAGLEERILSKRRGGTRLKNLRLRKVFMRTTAASRAHSLQKMAYGTRRPAGSLSAVYAWTHGSSVVLPYGTSTPYHHKEVDR